MKLDDATLARLRAANGKLLGLTKDWAQTRLIGVRLRRQIERVEAEERSKIEAVEGAEREFTQMTRDAALRMGLDPDKQNIVFDFSSGEVAEKSAVPQATEHAP